MKRLIALLAALCCLAALLTPVWAVQDEGTGADTGETGTAATDTGDTAEDPDASGEGGEDATDSAASDSETDQETDPEADQAADAETDSETGSDPAALTETAFQSVTITCTVDESGRAYFQETLELSIVGSVRRSPSPSRRRPRVLRWTDIRPSRPRKTASGSSRFPTTPDLPGYRRSSFPSTRLAW